MPVPASGHTSSDDEDNVPLSQRFKVSTSPAAPSSVTTAENAKDESSDDEDVALSLRVKSEPQSSPQKRVKSEPATPKKRVKKEASETPQPRKRAKTANGTSTTVKAATKTATKVKKETPAARTKREDTAAERTSPENDDDDDTYKWWEQQDDNDGSIKWTTLEHNGVLFPPPYEPLPSNVKLKYDGKAVVLAPEAEEVAGFFGAMLNSDHAQNPTFTANFFADFQQVLKDSGGAKTTDGKKIQIDKFEKCDFTQIFDHYERLRAEKKAMPAAEKKRLKAEKDKLEEKYKTCVMDGRKQPVGNFRIEPPGLFRGRGAHPKTGKLKARVQPEQVTINIGKDAAVPEPPAGHQWAEVRNDNTVSWLAMWRENINGNFKYVFLAQSSFLKGQSDFKKFEKARELKKHVDSIRADYTKELKSNLMVERQRATAMYLIDVLALRAGGEKGEDEADTVGCCSLRYEHITLEPPNKVTFDFLGKDSIRYYQQVTVKKEVFQNLKIFKKKPKGPGDDIFDRLDPSILNKHLQNYMPGLTAKVFRTYNASYTMQQQLDKIPNKGSVNEKVVLFNAANREVAILCNHQRTVAKSHEASVGKIQDRILELKWSKIRTKKMILQLEPKLKKKEPEYFAEIDDLDTEKVQQIHKKILEREKDRIEKKFARENEKLKADGDEPMPQEELNKRLEALDVMEAEFRDELKTDKPSVKASATVEKLRAQVDKFEERITNTELQLKDKEDNSTVALGTSKMNYIDPRLTVMFSKKFDVPIEKLFTKTLREKFKWAIESADENWRF